MHIFKTCGRCLWPGVPKGFTGFVCFCSLGAVPAAWCTAGTGWSLSYQVNSEETNVLSFVRIRGGVKQLSRLRRARVGVHGPGVAWRLRGSSHSGWESGQEGRVCVPAQQGSPWPPGGSPRGLEPTCEILPSWRACGSGAGDGNCRK